MIDWGALQGTTGSGMFESGMFETAISERQR
jgi:hypothetical protein